MSFIVETLRGLRDGLGMTVVLIIVSAPLGLALGGVSAFAGVYGPRPVRWLAAVYRSAIRGTPLLAQLFILYYGLPRVGIVLSPFAAAIAGFALCSGAYHSEYIRAALLSIPRAQEEAARALGLTRRRAVIRVVVPQALRRAVPGCWNEIVYLVKYSSLSYLVTLVELTSAGRRIAYQTFRFFEVFLIVGAVYLLLVGVVAGIGRSVERRLEIGRAPRGRGHAGRP